MIYQDKSKWNSAKSKRIMLFGMSGLGKTYISELLRNTGDWFHYSVDYRIGTRYMGEYIADHFKANAMQSPYLANLLRSDAISIKSKISFNNLAPLSSYLGKPGAANKGGIEFSEYLRRQRQHRQSEIASMQDTLYFIERAKALYDYDHFICDTSGSLVEVVDPNDPNDPVMAPLSQAVLPVWIKGDDQHTELLVERFKTDPKPMYYREEFLSDCWTRYLAETGQSEADVDPDAFIVWGYRALLQERLPRYEALAKNWGVTLQASDLQGLKKPDSLLDLIGDAIEANHAN